MPCREWFDAAGRRPTATACCRRRSRARVAVEAGVAQGWRELVGDAGRIVSLEHFGASADYKTLYRGVRHHRRGGRRRPPATASPPPADGAGRPTHRHRTTGSSLTRTTRMTDTGLERTRPTQGVVDLARRPLPRAAATGNLAELIATRHVVGVTTNPTIFADGAGQGRRATTSRSRDLAAARRRRRRGGARDHHRRRPRRLRRAAPGVRRHRRRRRPGVDRGRPAAGARHRRRPIAEARALWWLVDRPNLFIKIPATEEGLPAITAAHRRGHQRQRHADLLASSATAAVMDAS